MFMDEIICKHNFVPKLEPIVYTIHNKLLYQIIIGEIEPQHFISYFLFAIYSIFYSNFMWLTEKKN